MVEHGKQAIFQPIEIVTVSVPRTGCRMVAQVDRYEGDARFVKDIDDVAFHEGPGGGFAGSVDG